MTIANPDGRPAGGLRQRHAHGRALARRAHRRRRRDGAHRGRRPAPARVHPDGSVTAAMATAALEGPPTGPTASDFPYPHRFVSVGNPHVHDRRRRRRRLPAGARRAGARAPPVAPASAPTSRSTACATAGTSTCGCGSAAWARRAPAARAPARWPWPRCWTSEVERTVDVRLPGGDADDRGRRRPRDPPDRPGVAHRARRARMPALARAGCAAPDARLAPPRRAAGVPDGAHEPPRRRAARRRPRRDHARRRRPRPAAAAPAARAALAELVRRDDVADYPTNRGLAELREAVARFYRAPLRRRARPGARDRAAARRQGGARAPRAWPSSTRATRRSSPIPATRSTSAARRWPAPRPYGLPLRARARLPARPRRGARRRDRERANLLILRLPQQPDGRRGRRRRSTSASRRGGRSTTCRSATTTPTRRSPSTASWPRASCRPRAPARPASRSSRCPRRFSMPGWRIAFAVGNAELVGNLLRLKTHVDAGMFGALQRAAIALLDSDPAERRALAAVYERRRDLVCERLRGRRRRRPRAARRHVRLDAGAGRRRRGVRRAAAARGRRRRRRPAAAYGAGGRRLRAAGADGARRPSARGAGAIATRALSGAPTRPCAAALHFLGWPRTPTPSATPSPSARCVIAVLDQGDDGRRRARRAARAAAHGAGASPSARSRSTAAQPDPRTYLGSGKLDEVAAAIGATRRRGRGLRRRADARPSSARSRTALEHPRRRPHRGHPRHLRRATRTRRRASSRSSSRSWSTTSSACAACGSTSSEQYRAGVGTRGPGETQLETDRRLARDRIALLRRRLRETAQAARPDAPAPHAQRGADGRAGRLHQRRQVDAPQRAHGRRGLDGQPPVRDARPDHARLRPPRPHVHASPTPSASSASCRTGSSRPSRPRSRRRSPATCCCWWPTPRRRRRSARAQQRGGRRRCWSRSAPTTCRACWCSTRSTSLRPTSAAACATRIPTPCWSRRARARASTRSRTASRSSSPSAIEPRRAAGAARRRARARRPVRARLADRGARGHGRRRARPRAPAGGRGAAATTPTA